MNPMITPEATYTSAQDFLKMNDEDNAISVINDFILNSKKKFWTSNHESIIFLYVDLLIRKNKSKLLKDALNYYRNISQLTNIESFQSLISKTKDLVEEKYFQFKKLNNEQKLDAFDLDSDYSPELLYSYDDQLEITEAVELMNIHKFIWESYKILLDFTKTNSKLLNLYSSILKSAFNFCKENKRKSEFKRLCDSVRGYLQTLIKTENKTNFQNKVRISKPEVLKILIQIRINLLDTATYLEQWQEAFKTAEDTIFLMDKFEKQNFDNSNNNSVMSNKKNLKSFKIPVFMKLDFYSNVEKLLLISDYPLYHSYSTINIKELLLKFKKGNLNEIKIPKEIKSKIENLDLKNCYNNILLSALSTPYSNYYTNYLRVGEENNEYEKGIESETCSRMMTILKLLTIPSRKNLIQHIMDNRIYQHCDEEVSELFFLLEEEKNPLKISTKGKKIIENLKSKNIIESYIQSILKNMAVKILSNMANIYETISFRRVSSIISWIPENEIENIILENSRIGLISSSIDHENDMILFNTREKVNANLNENFFNFLNSVERIGTEIIVDSNKNKKKSSNLRTIVLNELNSFNSTSLTLSDNLLNLITLKTKELKEYIRKRDEKKSEMIEKKIKERNEAKEKAEKEAKENKELLKDELKQKEFDIQLKKFLIERIKVFTNAVVIENKKVRLDDLLKDLSKVKDDTLIKILENEEVEFKTKKEKKFTELAKVSDYTLREFRKRDTKKYLEILKQEEMELNKTREEKAKKDHEQNIKLKDNFREIKPFVDLFFGEIEKKKETEYEDKIEAFKKNLFEHVRSEFMKEVGNHFKTYITEFRKEEEENKKKQALFNNNSNKPQNNMAFGKGQRFRNDEKPKVSAMEFSKGANFIKSSDEPRSATTTLELKKGQKIDTQPTNEKLSKGTLIKDETDNKNKPSNTGIVRGAKVQEEPKKAEEPILIRGLKTEENPSQIVRGGKTDEKKDMTISRGTKTDEKKDMTINRGAAKPDEKKDSGIIRRGQEIKEEKKESTIIRKQDDKKDGKELIRGKIVEEKKETISRAKPEEKSEIIRRGVASTPTNTSSTIQRGKDIKKEEPKNEKSTKNEGGWRKNK